MAYGAVGATCMLVISAILLYFGYGTWFNEPMVRTLKRQILAENILHEAMFEQLIEEAKKIRMQVNGWLAAGVSSYLFIPPALPHERVL